MEFILESLRADWQSFLGFSPRLFYAIVLLLACLVFVLTVMKVFKVSLGEIAR